MGAQKLGTTYAALLMVPGDSRLVVPIGLLFTDVTAQCTKVVVALLDRSHDG